MFVGRISKSQLRSDIRHLVISILKGKLGKNLKLINSQILLLARLNI